MPATPSTFDRRRFLALASGAAASVTLSACGPDRPPPAGESATSGPRNVPTSTKLPTTSAQNTAPPTSASGVSGERALVVVQLNGGNDGLSALVPADGHYRDARPTIAIPEADVVALAGEQRFGLHPALSPLGALWAAGRLAFVESVGFAKPDRSHFVAMDTWWRAGDPAAASGWLGRVLDGLTVEPPPLYATALGSGAPLLSGERRQPTVVLTPSAFRFAEGLDPGLLTALASPLSVEPAAALTQRATARAVEAVGAFGSLVRDAPTEADDPPAREGAATLADGLDTAVRLLTSDVGARIVVVSASGFDTHANQVTSHQQLYTDLASGLTSFFDAVDAAGISDRVLVATTSEFGRRVHENGSGGTDHGAGGLSLVLGPVNPGIHGELDLGSLQDGDVRPSIDPRTLYTACLDWLGVDPAAILGRRFDEVDLLRR